MTKLSSKICLKSHIYAPITGTEPATFSTMHLHRILSLFLAIISMSLANCTNTRTDKDWSILFQVIPDQLSTEQANINIVFYLLKQTHAALMTEVEAGQFESKILSDWKRNSTNTEFLFCPNTLLKFNDNTNFHPKHLADSLEKLRVELGINLKTNYKANCVEVISPTPLPNLLKNLTNYRFAPTLKCAQNWECGLGSYAVSVMTPSKIVLNRKAQNKPTNGFDTITLARNTEFNSTEIIDDINRSIEDTPSQINLKKNYLSYDVNLLQTLIVILNDPDINVRKRLYDCIKPQDLSTAFNPNISSNAQIQITTILPSEFYSGIPERVNKSCDTLARKVKALNFVNWRNNNRTSLPEFLQRISVKTNIKINELRIDPSEFVKSLNTRDSKFKQFHLIPMAIGAESNDFSSFFRPLAAKGRSYLSYEIPGAHILYKQLLEANEPGIQIRIARLLADKISNNYAAVPMYQVKRTFYYPSNIMNLETGRSFLEYPEVGKLEIQ